jgi:hypothetical protein
MPEGKPNWKERKRKGKHNDSVARVPERFKTNKGPSLYYIVLGALLDAKQERTAPKLATK